MHVYGHPSRSPLPRLVLLGQLAEVHRACARSVQELLAVKKGDATTAARLQDLCGGPGSPQNAPHARHRMEGQMASIRPQHNRHVASARHCPGLNRLPRATSPCSGRGSFDSMSIRDPSTGRPRVSAELWPSEWARSALAVVVGRAAEPGQALCRPVWPGRPAVGALPSQISFHTPARQPPRLCPSALTLLMATRTRARVDGGDGMACVDGQPCWGSWKSGATPPRRP